MFKPLMNTHAENLNGNFAYPVPNDSSKSPNRDIISVWVVNFQKMRSFLNLFIPLPAAEKVQIHLLQISIQFLLLRTKTSHGTDAKTPPLLYRQGAQEPEKS